MGCACVQPWLSSLDLLTLSVSCHPASWLAPSSQQCPILCASQPFFMRKKYIVFTLQIHVMGCCQKGSGQASCQPWEANRNCFQWLLDKVIESEVPGDGQQSELVAWGPMSTSSHPEAWALRKNIDVFGLILPKRKRGESFNSEESWILPTKANCGQNGKVRDLEVITTVHNKGCHRS